MISSQPSELSLKLFHDPAGKRAKLRQLWYERGLYRTETLRQAMAKGAQANPNSRMIFLSDERPAEASLGELYRDSRRLAGALYALGLRRGDVIAIQVPNWLEGTLVYQAAMMLGATILPIVHIYGKAEVEFILATSRAKAFIVPDRWRNIDYRERLTSLGGLPHLTHVIVLGDDAPRGTIPWARLTETATDQFEESTLYPDDISVLIFTSGTTSDPKGVLHTHNTLLAEVRAGQRGADPPTALSPWPSGHIAGLLGILRLYVLGMSSVLMDAWDPVAAARAVERWKVTYSSGTPYFLNSFLEAAEKTGSDYSSLQSYLIGGTSVPASLIEKNESRGFPIFRSYGSSEHPTISSGVPEDPLARRANTDGRLTAGNDVRIVDEEGRDVPVGEDGEIVSIGPEQFIGYLDLSMNDGAFLDDLWFRTGDIGRMDEAGFLTVTDRKKDIIIRGGENISSKEIEDRLVQHSNILDAAVVAAPDERMGEIVCAFIVPREGASINLEDIGKHFREIGVARQKTPERLVLVRALPRTSAGKIKKFELRDKLN